MKRARVALLSLAVAAASAAADVKPNILWITCEDICPMLGCYGDARAVTPSIDALAARGLRFTRATSNAPVCAPARTALITGMYPASLGAQHMRSMVALPEGMKLYPQCVREAGYYCTNNQKTDYNVESAKDLWDECSRKAHWKNRPGGKPFFAVFNLEISHESQIRNKIEDKDRVHDPAKARVPAYHPDAPEVRANWAQHYDRITMMDAQAGKLLKEIEDAGLAGDTIIFFYGDNGCGMPRGKRWLYELGLRVPLIVHVPEKFQALAPAGYKAGGASGRLVGFVDMGPTAISLAGAKPPPHMQGRPFMGPFAADAPEFNFGFRNRMDERYDFSRSAEDGRWRYIRNYMPHLPQGQYLAYMFQTQTTQVWKKLFDEGKLTREQSAFWLPKAHEELYDIAADPDNVRNLAKDGGADAKAALQRLRKAMDGHLRATRDTGFIPEAEMHRRAAAFSCPHAMAQDAKAFPVERVMAAAARAADRDAAGAKELAALLADPDATVRYWGVLGLLIRGEDAVKGSLAALRPMLKDESPSARIAAAEALGRFGEPADLDPVLETLIAEANPAAGDEFRATEALNVIDRLGDRAKPLGARIKAVPRKPDGTDGKSRTAGYPGRLLDYLLPRFGG